MSITPPCEISVKEILPAIRSIIANKLVKEKGLPIYEAAKLMGVTPAAVKNYTDKKRGNSSRELIENDKRIMDMISDLVEKIYSGSNLDLSTYYCLLCAEGKKALKRNGIEIPSCIYESTAVIKQ
ncbi:transcriptional regulator [Acidianus sulfidivorans JP7]|uniref:Transcriptional regulator n=1 Tax=Acidianus sulfidivorans JP7 TaxID=619593 RepID=A0A2U9IP61_9CREN|nr:transcriptional regulator [Acidianus sulfidivorans]AWR97791.1 transcriptional regulator [Acidianus sulfidivorans JP7]